ncbi:MAG TPA: 30S ribosomal protein S7, partial [Desulfuromonadales bacterium]|nr:30S ribosomal protein S7 [Desulfuromonadales bacterium]
MPRRREVAKRVILPDPKYNDRLVAKFMNAIMLDGKKSVAESIVYGAFDIVGERSGEEPLALFKKAIENVRPVVEVKSRRVGGSTYQVPVEVRPDRRNALAIRWLMAYARARGEKTMQERLAGELLDAANSRGASVK